MNYQDIEARYKRITDKDWNIIRDAARGWYVEVGTNHGASACAAAQNADLVTTIDIFDWQPKLWEGHPEAAKIHFFKGTSADFAQSLKRPEIDVLFIDGAHEYEYVLMDCKALVPWVKPGGAVMFHDYNPLNQTTLIYQAVNEFIQTINHKDAIRFPDTNLFKITKL